MGDAARRVDGTTASAVNTRGDVVGM